MHWIFVPKAARAKGEFLADASRAALEETRRQEKPGKSGGRHQAANLGKRGHTLEEVADAAGKDPSTVSRRLNRMEREGVDAVQDRKSPGRPRNITPEQGRVEGEDLDKPLGESGFDRGGWNYVVPARHARDTFDAACSPRTAQRVADRLGFSFRKARTMPYNGATAGERTKFIEKMTDPVAGRKAEGRVAPAVDATTPRDSPTSSGRLWRRGGKHMVRANCSKRANRIIGVLGGAARRTRGSARI